MASTSLAMHGVVQVKVQTSAALQERVAPSAVTHRILTPHPYNTGQQTGVADEQLNICEIMRGKFTPTDNNCDCAQAVMGYLEAAAVTTRLECTNVANVNMQMQT